MGYEAMLGSSRCLPKSGLKRGGVRRRGDSQNAGRSSQADSVNAPVPMTHGRMVRCSAAEVWNHG